jgi:hypothetical protein
MPCVATGQSDSPLQRWRTERQFVLCREVRQRSFDKPAHATEILGRRVERPSAQPCVVTALGHDSSEYPPSGMSARSTPPGAYLPANASRNDRTWADRTRRKSALGLTSSSMRMTPPSPYTSNHDSELSGGKGPASAPVMRYRMLAQALCGERRAADLARRYGLTLAAR